MLAAVLSNHSWFLAPGPFSPEAALGNAVIAVAVLALLAGVYQWLSRLLPLKIKRHLSVWGSTSLATHRRSYPYHVALDAQRGVERWIAGRKSVRLGVPVETSFMKETTLSQFLAISSGTSATSVDFESFDTGEDESASCVRNAMWLITDSIQNHVVLWTSSSLYDDCGVKRMLNLEFCSRQDDADEVGHDLAAEFFEVIEESVRQMASYRGKILSLEHGDGYDGASTALKVHELRSVARDEVVLPQATLDLLERNVIRFARQRGALSERGLAAKKGLLFYGPPGNGKTHTLHFLFSELKDHSTLLITAEQVGLLEQYMTLARLIQPTLVVLEDVDLIAESRENSSPGQQSLLNRLLNEMDGLKKDAEVMFLMTTNRPEAIESALAARPGRVDQAVEFPPPDASGRRKLVAMYAAGSHLDSDVLEHLVSRTEGVSASFIKELMRRSVQFHLEAKPGAERICLSLNDVDQALDEMLLGGGPLNRILLGAGDFDDGSN